LVDFARTLKQIACVLEMLSRVLLATIAGVLFATPAIGLDECKPAGTGGKICVHPECQIGSNGASVEVWISEKGTLTWSQSGNHTLKKIHHYNVRSNCFGEQREIGLQAGALVVQNGGCNLDIQACERSGSLLAVSRCSAWAGTFSPYDSLCVAAPPPPKADPCAGRMGTEGCPFPSFGGSSAQNDFTNFCAEYASQAVAVVAKAATIRNCVKTGDRWTPNVSAHAQWCLTLNGDPSRANAETAARAAELDACYVASRKATVGIKKLGKAKTQTP
jgi:hypothetical protein